MAKKQTSAQPSPYTQGQAEALVRSSETAYVNLVGAITATKPEDRVKAGTDYLEAMLIGHQKVVVPEGQGNAPEYRRIVGRTREVMQAREGLLNLASTSLGPREITELITEADKLVYSLTAIGYASQTPIDGETKIPPEQSVQQYRVGRIMEAVRRPQEEKPKGNPKKK